MTTRIFRHEVPVDDKVHTFDLHGDPLGVGSREVGVVEFWAIHHDEGVDPQVRSFLVVGTGHPLPTGWRHCGHVYDAGGLLVWHLIEVAP